MGAEPPTEGEAGGPAGAGLSLRYDGPRTPEALEMLRSKSPLFPAHPAPARRAALAAIGACAWIGCGGKAPPTLVGDWSGAADCGQGSVTTTMTLTESNPQSYLGVGEVLGLQYGGVSATVDMELVLEQPEPEGAQTVSVAASCLIVTEGGAEVVDCSGFSELGWDGADTLGAEVTDFMSSGLDCSLELRR